MAELRAAEQSLYGLGLQKATLQKLDEMALKASTPERPVTPVQLAAQLLEEAVANR